MKKKKQRNSVKSDWLKRWCHAWVAMQALIRQLVYIVIDKESWCLYRIWMRIKGNKEIAWGISYSSFICCNNGRLFLVDNRLSNQLHSGSAMYYRGQWTYGKALLNLIMSWINLASIPGFPCPGTDVVATSPSGAQVCCPAGQLVITTIPPG